MALKYMFTAAAVLVAAPFALADGHGQLHGHASAPPAACCHSVDGQTAQVLVAPSQQTIRRIQAELAVAGFNPGPIDGVMGQRTRTALRTFQRDQGLYEGLLTVETLSRLGLSVGGQSVSGAHQHGRSCGHAIRTVQSAHIAHSASCGCGAHHGHARSVRRIVTRRVVSPSQPVVPAETVRLLPNYVGRSSQHQVEALDWNDRTVR